MCAECQNVFSNSGVLLFSVSCSALFRCFCWLFLLVSLPTPPLEFPVWASSNHCAAGEGPSAPELKNLTTKSEAPKVVKVVYKTFLRELCA